VFPPEYFQPLLADICRVLGERQIPFALTGGLVSAFYSEPRYTQDADLVVDRDSLLEHLDDCIAQFMSLSYLLNEQEVQQAVKRGRMFQIIHTVEMLKIDFYPKELVEGELSRAVTVELFPGLSIPIITRADLVLSKLVWISKGSHKSRRDVKQMMRRVSREEDAHVRHYADQLNLIPLLEEVLAEPWEIE